MTAGSSRPAARIIALWAVPRSVSTAFERMVRERGDLTVFSEPFSASYYFSPDRVSDRFETRPAEPGETYRAVLDRLHTAAAEGSVFVKDMASHVAPVLDERFVERFTNTFIIRDPRRALPSLHEMWPDFTREEAGYEVQRRLFDLTVAVTGRVPPVIDADDLRAAPETVVRAWCDAAGLPFVRDALTWEAGVDHDDWERWGTWYESARDSTGFAPPTAGPPPEPPDERVAALARDLMAHYEHLGAHRLRGST